MQACLFLLATLWRGRGLWLTLTLTGAAIGLFASLSQPSQFTAKVTLQVDTSKNLSPLLASLQNPGHVALLNDVLKGPSLLTDTARDSGIIINPKGLHLSVPAAQLITIRYTAEQRQGLEKATDTLAYNFIYELLAPERLRLEQRVASLQSKLAQTPQTSTVSGTDTPDDAQAATRKATEDELAQMQEAMNAITAAFDQGTPQAVIWFAEPARMEPYTPRQSRHLQWCLLGGALGLLLSLSYLAWKATFPKGPQTEKSLSALTHLPVLGLLPDVGHITVLKGQPQVMAGHTTLHPVNFTEVTRLHRTLTRGLHGTLVLTGVMGGEGTSLLALLLAQKSAQSGKSTLLVDLNLKSPWLTKATQHAPVAWNLAKAKATSKSTITDKTVELGANLSLLPSPGDEETLAYLKQPENVQAWFEKLGAHYDHIIVDTSPVMALNRQNADPVSLVAAAARSVLVVMMGITPNSKVEGVADLLTRHGNVIGVVGNNQQNPSPRVVLLGALSALARVAPGLAAWLRAKLQRME